MTFEQAGKLTIAMLLISAFSGPLSAAERSNPEPIAKDAVEHVGGVLETTDGVYRFTPAVCAIHVEDGFPDIEVAGPGLTAEGESFYLDFSSTANEVTLELGVNKPFASVDRTVRAGEYVSSPFNSEVIGKTISVTDLNLINEQDEPVATGATMQIDCS